MVEVDLRGTVLSKYRNIKDFAEDIGWAYGKTYRILVGKQLPDTSDIRSICQTLGLDDPESIVRLFSLT